MSDSSSESENEKIVDSKLPMPSNDESKEAEPEEEITFAKLVYLIYLS